MRNAQEPVEEDGLNKAWDPEAKEYSHPAFAQISASRCQGGHVALYGSDFRHNAFIEVRISRSKLCRGLSHDWHFPEKELLSVMLSEAQWATFVSTLNHGSGVPCTIRHAEGEPAPDITLRNERDVAEREMDARVKRVADHLKGAIKDIEANLAGLSKAKRDAILERVRKAEREVADSMPFAAKSFAEHTEKVIENAKIEVEAYMHGAIVRAGLQALGAPPPPSLGSTEQP